MPIILRKFQSLPMHQPDDTFVSAPYATIAFVDEHGAQYAQLNVPVGELPEGAGEGDALVLSVGEPHDMTIPADHAEMILP